MSSYDTTKQWVFDKKSWDPPNWSIPISECSNIFFLYFHTRDNDHGHGHERNFKQTFFHQKWHNNVKNEKEKGENLWKIKWKYMLSLRW